MHAPQVPPPGQIDDLDFGIAAISTVRTSLAFTLECLSRAAVNAPGLKEALEDALSLASRRELEVRVLKNIHCMQLPASAIASPYDALKAY